MTLPVFRAPFPQQAGKTRPFREDHSRHIPAQPGAALVRMLFYESLYFDYPTLMPILNRYALSALAATACNLTRLWRTKTALERAG